jgi:pimeloyl-[acyl-carrier protein] methyl ester esterase
MKEPREGGTILWLPGWSMEGEVFAKLQEELPEFEHTSVDYGHARNASELLELGEQAMAAVIRDKQRGPILLAGWSLGGLLALQLSGKLRPAALLLFATNARFTRPKEERSLGWPDAYVRQMVAGLKKDRIQVEGAFRQAMFTERERERGTEKLLPPAGSWELGALLAGLELLRSSDSKAMLAEVACPVLIIQGGEDRICPHGAAEELHAQLPQSILHVVEAAGHVPFLGREAKLAARLRRWWHEQQTACGSSPV